jgi:hypothetical protein
MSLETKGLRRWLLPTTADVGGSMGEGLDSVRIHCKVIEVWNLKRKSKVE